MIALHYNHPSGISLQLFNLPFKILVLKADDNGTIMFYTKNLYHNSGCQKCEEKCI